MIYLKCSKPTGDVKSVTNRCDTLIHTMNTNQKWYIAIPRFVLRLISYGIGGILSLAVIGFCILMVFGLLLYGVYGVAVTQYYLTSPAILETAKVRIAVTGTVIVLAVILRLWKEAEGFTYGVMQFIMGVGVTWITFMSHAGTNNPLLQDRLPFVVGSLFLIKGGIDSMAEALKKSVQ